MQQPKPRAGGARAEHAASRPEFMAAVRFRNGRKELFRVRNADDLDDARAVVLAELDDVQAVVIAPHR